jgi:acylphosphatase
MGADPQGYRSVRVSNAGRVQGLGFRDWVETLAAGLGLAGWVRNRRDGTVEALFAGPAAAVADMLARCRHGPRSAHVISVTVLEEGGSAPTNFQVRPTA